MSSPEPLPPPRSHEISSPEPLPPKKSLKIIHWFNSRRKFRYFEQLPTELRLLVWDQAILELDHKRVTILRDPILTESLNDLASKTDQALFTATPVQVKDDRLALLHACPESRSVLLPRLTGAFGLPKPGYYPFLSDRASLQALLKLERFSPVRQNLIPNLLEAAVLHFNDHPNRAKLYPKIITTGPPLPRLEPPLWFNNEEDFLLIPHSRSETPYRATSRQWDSAGTLYAAKVKRLAFEMSRADWDNNSYASHSIFPAEEILSKSLHSAKIEYEKLQSVQEVALWTREGCEVIRLKTDTQSVLQPGEWSFRLDTVSKRFKHRMGDRWSNMTWHIVMGREFHPDGREKNVMEHLRDWKPHSSLWWNAKLAATKGMGAKELGKKWMQMKARDRPVIFGYDRPYLVEVKGSVPPAWYGQSFGVAWA